MSKSRGHANNGTGSPALVKWLGSAVFGYKETSGVELSGEVKQSAPLSPEEALKAAQRSEEAGEV